MARRSVWAELAPAPPAWSPRPKAKDRPLDSYDPVITGTVSLAHSVTPESNTVFTGTNELYENTTTANFNYTQGFPTGTLLTVGFDNTRLWQSSFNNTINPTLTPSFTFQVRQHLLQGFGYDPNLRYHAHRPQ